MSGKNPSRSVLGVKTLSVREVAKHFSSVLESVEQDQEEIVLVRKHRQIARLVPEPELDDETAEALVRAVNGARNGKRTKLGNLLRAPQ